MDSNNQAFYFSLFVCFLNDPKLAKSNAVPHCRTISTVYNFDSLDCNTFSIFLTKCIYNESYNRKYSGKMFKQ